MIVLFTDFGWNGPYVGQMKARILMTAPNIPIVDLLHDVPPFDVYRASYLLASYAAAFPAASYFVAVVDPGVGSALREPVILEADGRVYVGPGNGLFDQVIAQAQQHRLWRISWQPSQLSASFHGRDIFAPVAAMLATGNAPEQIAEPLEWMMQGWPKELSEVIYLDPYGNAITGLQARHHQHVDTLLLNSMVISRHLTFADVAAGAPFFYENANGLLEIAVNQGRADRQLNLCIGTRVVLQ